MLNGLDLFSGIGGISRALDEWIKPIAYCESDRHAQSVLLSRMERGELAVAPIWDDITTLRGDNFLVAGLPAIEIIFGGFPCQDISVAGAGAGLDGKRSGLFFEVLRLIEEIRPAFIFLENVPAIRTRGANRVCFELASLGYDLRWTTVTAASVGAPHKRERWFLLAHSRNSGQRELLQQVGKRGKCKASDSRSDGKVQSVADAASAGLQKPRSARFEELRTQEGAGLDDRSELGGWWSIEPDVGRVANGVPHRVDRIKRLGNGVVPFQVKTAFEILIGVNT